MHCLRTDIVNKSGWPPLHTYSHMFGWFLVRVVYYESIKRELKTRPIYECRCDERLKTKAEESTRLAYTGLRSMGPVTLPHRKQKSPNWWSWIRTFTFYYVVPFWPTTAQPVLILGRSVSVWLLLGIQQPTGGAIVSPWQGWRFFYQLS